MELICDSGKLTEERTGGFRAHADHILSRHSPVFRTEQLEARRAEEMLAAKGISARVIDMHTWKPLDEELVLRAAAETGCIVTAENHQVGTGLGSAITNLTSAKNPVPVGAFLRAAADTALRKKCIIFA